MSQFERIYRIHRLLRAVRQPVPMQRFMEELEASRNTITRDFQHLRDILGAPLEYVRDKGHRYDPSAPVFELPGLWLNASELHALLVCEQLLEDVQPGLMRDRLGPLKARIRQLLDNAGGAADRLGDLVKVQPMQARSVDDRVFLPVADALLSGRKLEFLYAGRASGRAGCRTVDPQRLLHYRHNWYLAARCREAAALRLFSLDRISHIKVLESEAETVPSQELEDFTRASFGIFSGKPCAIAHLRFTPEAARWVADELWHPEQRSEWHEDGYHLQVPYSDPTELVMEVLKHGAEVEVLEPEGLRERVAEEIRRMGSLY